LERKRADESARRFRGREALEIAEPIAQELASWAQDALADLAESRPNIPDALDDRAEETWEPLLAIADLAGGAWPERARLAAIELSASRETADEALGPWLLRDIRDVLSSRGVDRMSSADLAASLAEIETSPWGEIRGKALDARALARRLRPFKIRPRSVRLADDTTPKGYLLEQFQDAFARYLGDLERHTGTTAQPSGFAHDPQTPHVASDESPDCASANGCGDVADGSPPIAEDDREDEHEIERLAEIAREMQRHMS
jgi:putative DNA primase/helicase